MPLLPILSRAPGAPGRALRAALTGFAALLLITCSGDTPIGPGRPGIGTLRVAPQFDAFAHFVPLTLDNVRVIVVRPPSDTIANVSHTFSPNSQQLQIDVPVLLQGTSEDLAVTLKLFAGTTLLFQGTDTINVTAGSSTPASSIPVQYEGPGKNITGLTISPRDTTVPLNAVVPFGATAVDDSGPVTSFYVNWSSSGGAINAAGTFTAPGVRDTVFIVAVTPNQVRDSTRVFISAAPSTMVKVSGDLQTGLASSRLPQPLAVQVNGTDGFPVAGAVVNFAVTTGGGSVDSSVAHTDAAGIARTGATLGGAVGQQTFTASATGLTPVVFSATATSGIVWTGAVSTDWHTAGNWSPAQVPGIADNVTVPVTANQPVASTTVNVNDLTIAAGATVTLGTTFTFNVAGNLTATGNLLVSGGTPTIQLSGTGKTLVGQVANASITGTITLAGTTTVSGNVTISGGTASLDIGIFAMQVGGSFSTGSGGRLIMTTGGGQLNITGSAAFGGRDETGFLTAGAISIGGNFTQTGSGSPTSFAPSGTHTTGFTGPAATHTINFGTPGAGAAGSHFSSLDISATGTVSLATDVNVDGLLSSAGGTPPTLGTTGVTHRLNAVSVSVTGLIVNQATLTIGSGTIVAFNGVQFTNSPTTVAQLTVNHPGALTAFNFTDLSFATTPVGPNGFYMDVTDNDGVAPSLVINMVTPTPGTPGLFVRTAGGAAVNWPSTQPIVTWDGSASTNWSDLNNWTPAQVPTNADDVVIPSVGITNFPAITASCSAKSLTVNSGATLNLGSANCQVGGNVFADGAVVGTGAIQIATTAQIRGNFSSLTLSARITEVGPVLATGNVTVTGANGSFVIGGQPLTMGGNLAIQGGARLVMINPADLVSIAGSANFSGGFELDSLSAGTLTIGGNLTQVGTGSGDSFHPSGTHLTIFSGNTPTINFGSPGDVPGTSHFQGLAWTGTGTLTLATPAFAHGVFTTTSTGPVTISGGGGGFQFGSLANAGHVNFNNVRVALVEPTGGPLSFSNATLQGLTTTTVTQLSVSHPGVGGPFTFNNLTFGVTPTGPGLYLGATDNNQVDGTALTINVTNSTPASGAPFFAVVNGAVVNWPPAAPVPNWTGAVSTNWSVGGNWSSGLVPSPTDSVVIPAAANQPVLTATTSVGAVNVQGGTLTLNGHILTVARTFVTSATGTVTMTNAADSLRISGNAIFGGGSELNLLSAGTTQVGGNLTQLATTSLDSYDATGSHQTLFTGSPTITFASPGSGSGSSHFEILSVPRPSTVTLGSDIVAQGGTHGNGIGQITLQGTGQSFTKPFGGGGGGGGVDSGLVVFNNVRFIISQTGSGADTLSDFTFQGLSPTAVQLTINHPGNISPIAINNVTFGVIPTTGFYISANDVNPSDGIPLVINVTNSSPSSGGAFVQQLNGAVVNWPAIFPAATWTGAADGNWFNGGNWNTGAVPTSTTDVVIPAGPTNFPTLTANAATKSLTVNVGASLTLAGFTLTANGNVFADAQIGSPGTINMATAGQVRGSLPSLTVSAPVTAIGTVIVTGNLTIAGATANYTAGAVNTFISGSLLTQSGGTLTMTNTNDVVSVLGSASFGGGDETGKLIQGILQVESNFTQLGIATSFAASGNHTTQLTGQGPTPTINFGDPVNSRFQNLDVTAANVLLLQTSVTVLGQLSSVPGTALDTLRAATPGPVLTAGGAIVTGLVLDGVPLVLTGGPIPSFSKVTFRNQSPSGIALTVSGTGAGGPFTFDQLTFSTILSSGLHLQANDNDGPTANGALTINVTNSSPPVGAGFFQANNGAVVNWPPVAPIAQWTGGAGTSDWNTANNWSTNAVPGPIDSVVIVASTTTPVLTVPVAIGAVNIASGNITVGGQILQVARTLTTTGTGTLTMNNVSDQVIVGGNAIFNGGSTSTRLTHGLLSIGGNFIQLATTSTASFAADTGHTTEFTAPNPTIGFATPGPNASHFGNLTHNLFSPTFTLTSNVTALGFLSGGDGFGGTINGTCGSVLTVRDAFSGGMTLDCVSLVIDDPLGLGAGLNSITFLNQASNVSQLTIRHPGIVAGAYSLNNITWTPLTGGNTGFYLSANDVNGGTGGGLLVNVSSNDPGNGPLFQQVVNGASIHWPGQPIIWTGAAGNSIWTDGGNWQLFAPPSSSDSVVIPNVASQPVLNADLSVGAINITGGNITMNGHTLTVARTFATTGIGTLTMTNPADQLLVQGNVLFDGAGGGVLSAGTIAVAGNFTQGHTTSAASFAPTLNHSLSLFGAGTQTVTFADSVSSFVRNLVITNVSNPGVRPASIIQVTGFLSMGPGTKVTATDLGINGTGFNVLGTVGIATGGDLTVGRLYVGGTISSAGTYAPTSTIFTGAGQAAPSSLPYKNVYIDGTVTFDPGVVAIANDLVLSQPTSVLNMGGPVNVTGSLFIQGGNLQPNGQPLTVAGNLTTTGNGTLTMGNEGDQVTLGGSATFGGGPDVLSLGTLRIGANFTQLSTTSPASFAASCNHQTQFTSLNPTISFQSPGAAQSHFGSLLGNAGNTLTIGSPVTVVCTLSATNGFNGGIKGTGTSALTVQSFNNSGLVVFDGAQLELNDIGGFSGGLANLTFVNQPTSVAQLTIVHPGIGGQGILTLSGITWSPLTGGNTGFYISAQDLDGLAPQLVVSALGTTDPGNGPAFTKLSGGAFVLWPGAPIQWSGANGNDSWTDPLNWIGGMTPTAANDAQIPTGTPFTPRVTGTQDIRNLIILSGATMAINDATLNVSGSVTSSGTITDPGGGTLSLNGTGQTIIGNIGQASVAPGANYGLAGAASADLNMGVQGSLALNGFIFTVNGNFSTAGNGVLAMQNPADQLIVTGDVQFGGGSTVGSLTQGILSVGGNFFQTSGTSTASFAASGNHVVSLTGAAPHTVNLAGNGVGSVFASLLVSGSGALNAATNLQFTHDLATSGGTINLNGHNFIVVGNFSTGGAGTLTMTDPADVLTVGGAAVFNGGSTAGLLTNGVLGIGTIFDQLNATSNLSFAPSGLHRTVTGTASTISFQSPGTGAGGSHFNALDVTGATGGLAFTTGAFVDSALITSVGAGAPKISGVGVPLTSKQWLVANGLQVTNMPMVLDEGGVARGQQFAGVTFAGFPTTPNGVALIDVTGVGAALAPRTMTFTGTQLQTSLGAGGQYLRVSSSNLQGLTVIMSGSNDTAGGPARSQALTSGAGFVWQ